MTLLEELREIIGDRTDDAALNLIERVSDYESEGIEDLKAKIENLEKANAELDEAWRKRYRDRFYEGEKIEEKPFETERADETEITIEDLFEDKK